jgi:hypothetical protein
LGHIWTQKWGSMMHRRTFIVGFSLPLLAVPAVGVGLPLLPPMEVILVARSIGKKYRDDKLSPEGHAGLVLNLGQKGEDDHWIAQAGPSSDYLVGSVRQCPQHGWHREFSLARGAVWRSPNETVELPVEVLMRGFVTRLPINMLVAISDRLNGRRLRYVYDTGPNSNTWVRMFLQQMILAGAFGGVPPVLRYSNQRELVLKGWDWGLPPRGY